MERDTYRDGGGGREGQRQKERERQTGGGGEGGFKGNSEVQIIGLSGTRA